MGSAVGNIKQNVTHSTKTSYLNTYGDAIMYIYIDVDCSHVSVVRAMFYDVRKTALTYVRMLGDQTNKSLIFKYKNFVCISENTRWQ